MFPVGESRIIKLVLPTSAFTFLFCALKKYFPLPSFLASANLLYCWPLNVYKRQVINFTIKFQKLFFILVTVFSSLSVSDVTILPLPKTPQTFS